MPGFFSASLANSLTNKCYHYIDWSRVGSLLRSSHRYSNRELLQRAVVITSIGAGGYVGRMLSEDDSIVKSTVGCMAGCFVGFVLSHLVVIAPLVYKRYQMQRECSMIESRILSQLVNFNQLNLSDCNENMINPVIDLISHIKNHSCSNEHGSKASQTWGYRKRMLNCLSDTLDSQYKRIRNDYDEQKLYLFWNQEPEDLCHSIAGENDTFKNRAATVSS